MTISSDDNSAAEGDSRPIAPGVDSTEKSGPSDLSRTDGRRKAFLTREAKKTPDSSGPDTLNRFLSSPYWQAIGVFVAVLLFATPYLASRYAEYRTRPVLVPHVTYRFDGPSEWTEILTVANRGGRPAQGIHVVFAGTNTLCTSVLVSLDGDSPEPTGSSSGGSVEPGYGTGSDCEGGVELISVRAKEGGDLPGLFLGDVEDEGLVPDLSLYSAKIPMLKPDEVAWIELSFRSAPDVDSELVNLLDLDSALSPEALGLFLEKFSYPKVSGDGFTVRGVEFEAIRAK